MTTAFLKRKSANDFSKVETVTLCFCKMSVFLSSCSGSGSVSTRSRQPRPSVGLDDMISLLHLLHDNAQTRTGARASSITNKRAWCCPQSGPWLLAVSCSCPCCWSVRPARCVLFVMCLCCVVCCVWCVPHVRVCLCDSVGHVPVWHVVCSVLCVLCSVFRAVCFCVLRACLVYTSIIDCP